MKVEKLGLVTWFLSGLAIMIVLVMVPLITVEIQQIWKDLDTDMDGFRLNAETLWAEIMELRRRHQEHENTGQGGRRKRSVPRELSNGLGPQQKSRRRLSIGPPSIAIPQPPAVIDDPNTFFETLRLPDDFNTPTQLLQTRHPQQSGSNIDNTNNRLQKQSPQSPYYYQAVAPPNNKCVPQPGPRGYKGPPGRNGEPGHPGRQGPPGEDYKAEPVIRESFSCVTCPRGYPGRKGPNGPGGKPGSRGAPGYHGNNGRCGQKGYNGDLGPMGPSGKRGGRGYKGPRGLDTERVLGRPGAKGDRGLQGSGGDPGFDGTDGYHGSVGELGPRGLFGPQGNFPNKSARLGRPGNDGKPGGDGGYCSCPDRSQILNAYKTNRRENY